MHDDKKILTPLLPPAEDESQVMRTGGNEVEELEFLRLHVSQALPHLPDEPVMRP